MTIPDDDGIDIDLVSEHGMLSHEAISNWATAVIVGQQTRTAQDNEMLYTCLFNSTSEDVKKKLLSKTSKINGTEIAALLYKHLVATVEVETKATVAQIRIKLMNLHNTIATLNYDIDAFHLHLEELVTSLASHGKTSEDLIVYLFKAYKSIPDKGFNQIIKRKHSDYSMGTEDLEVTELKTFAQTCYDMRKADTADPWLANKSQEEVEFEALTANFNTLKSANEKLAKALKAKIATGGTKKVYNPKQDKPKANTGKYAWKDVAPGSNEPKEKKVNNKQYYWCLHHKAWTIHKPEDCRLQDRTANVAETGEESTDQDDTEDAVNDESALALAAAFAMDL